MLVTLIQWDWFGLEEDQWAAGRVVPPLCEKLTEGDQLQQVLPTGWPSTMTVGSTADVLAQPVPDDSKISYCHSQPVPLLIQRGPEGGPWKGEVLVMQHGRGKLTAAPPPAMNLALALMVMLYRRSLGVFSFRRCRPRPSLSRSVAPALHLSDNSTTPAGHDLIVRGQEGEGLTCNPCIPSAAAVAAQTTIVHGFTAGDAVG